ncbi:MAG: nucleic acid binding, OB-fold, tRNA/helicase-type [Marmoricola sp.]|nr:nucleic acid binding, OB-fold, tRNA/helicase-type [Marmoricola sp.]
MSQTTGGLRAGIRRWASQANDEAVDLKREVAKAGCLRIENAPDRELVTVQGTLKTVTLRPRGGVPALEAELYDGTGTITVLWLGRRRIAGIFPGRAIRVSGRIGVHNGDRVIYNPRYDLRY